MRANRRDGDELVPTGASDDEDGGFTPPTLRRRRWCDQAGRSADRGSSSACSVCSRVAAVSLSCAMVALVLVEAMFIVGSRRAASVGATEVGPLVADGPGRGERKGPLLAGAADADAAQRGSPSGVAGSQEASPVEQKASVAPTPSVFSPSYSRLDVLAGPSSPPEPPLYTPPPPPPPPPPARQWRSFIGNLDASKCDAMMMHPSSNAAAYHFHRLWGREAWRFREPGQASCWDERGGQAWIEEVVAGRHCGWNWFEGATGDLGRADLPTPTWPLDSAPALLGTEAGIMAFCREAMGAREGDSCPWTGLEGGGCGGFDNELAHRCARANQNVLRLTSRSYERRWDMCQNLEWVTCAAMGRLPGQGDAGLHFANEPASLVARWFDKHVAPGTTAFCDQCYTVSAVFYAEVCLLARLCRNSASMFAAGVGEPITCVFDVNAFRNTTDALRAATLPETRPNTYEYFA